MIVPTTLVSLAVAVAPWTIDGPVSTLEVPHNLGGVLSVAVAPWTINGPVPTLEVPFASDVFNLGGVLGAIPDTVAFWVGLDPPRTMFISNRGVHDPSSDSSDAFGSSAPYSSVVFVLKLGSSRTLYSLLWTHGLVGPQHPNLDSGLSPSQGL